MVTLEWDLDRADGVTLVSLFVEAPHTCRVRIENRLDGPVWPPRRRGRPAAGWDDDGFVGVVPADGRLTVGYSTSAPAKEPPAEIVSTDAVDATDGASALDAPRSGRAAPPTTVALRRTTGHDGGDVVPAVESSPDGVVRTLGDPVVPRDCVPIPAQSGGTASVGAPNDAAREQDGRSGIGWSRRRSRSRSETANRRFDADSPASDADWPPRGRPGGRIVWGDPSPGVEALVVPSAVSAWLGDVERRLDAFEGKTVERESAFGQVRDAERLDGPTDERASVDEGLAAAVAADRRALGRIAERVDVLAARAGVAGGADDGPADGER